MGSPISPSFADLVMEILIMTVTSSLPFDIPVLRKFVDDLVLALPKTQVHNTLQAFNRYNSHLQITMEEERERSLPFLDMLLIRNDDQSISTQWYIKDIASGRLLNWFSYHPTSMKVHVADNFIKRVIRLTTSQTTEQHKNVIYEHLRKNNYPATLISRLYNKLRNSPRTPSDDETFMRTTALEPETTNIRPSIIQQQHQAATQHSESNQQSPRATAYHINTPQSSRITQASSTTSIEVYRSLPYIPKLSQMLIRTLKTDYALVKIAHKTIKTVSSLLKPVKDPVSYENQSNVIYSIPCSDCGMTYVGMTTNKLKTRLYGHRSNINKYTQLTQTRNSNTERELEALGEKTALIYHMIERKHNFNLEETKILDRANRGSTLAVLEMCHIVNADNTVNFRTDTYGLSSTYAHILYTIRKFKPNTTLRNNQEHTNTLERLSSPTDSMAQHDNPQNW